MAKLKDGFYKLTASSIGSDLLVLLAGGGAKPISDFALADGTNATGTWSINISGKSATVNCTEATSDTNRPIVVTNKSNGLYYTTKATLNYSTGNITAPTFTGALKGNADTATTASKLSTVSKTAWGLTYWTSGGVPTSISGDMTGVGNITIASGGNADRFITFDTASTRSWRIGYLGSGSGDANYLAFQSTKTLTATDGWHDMLKIGCETGNAILTGLLTAKNFVSGDGINDFTAGTVKLDVLNIPTSNGGTTFGPGSNGQVLKSNGTTVYWASDNNSNSWRAVQVNGTQIAGTGTGTYALNFISGTCITVAGTSGSSSAANSITITNAGVRSVAIGTGSNSSKVAVNTNGTTAYLTIPYASSAGALGNYSIQHFMTYDNSNNNYLAASFTNENFSKKAAEKYIEYWDSTGGWFNSRWGLVLAISGFHRVGSSDSYVLLGGGGHKLESNLSVNYAASTGNADTVDSCHKDDFLRRTATLGYLNKFVLEDIPKGVTQVGSIGWTDYQNHPYAGGLWMTLRGTSSLSTALILFPSYSMSSPPILYSSVDGGAWQGGHQLAYTSQIPTTMAWGSITGKPSTFTPSTHYHNYFPENTAVYFRDPNNASWRGGMYWGSAGNEALCFAVVNANTSFRFFTGSDLANWTSSTWQGTPAFEVNKNGAYAPHFYESSDQRLKTNIQAILNKDNIPQIKEFDWKSDGKHSYGLIAQELEAMGYSELVEESGDHKTVNYSAALSLIVGKLQVKIKELEKEIEILKNKN